MATSQAHFKWTDSKLTNIIKCLQDSNLELGEFGLGNIRGEILLII